MPTDEPPEESKEGQVNVSSEMTPEQALAAIARGETIPEEVIERLAKTPGVSLVFDDSPPDSDGPETGD